jgi:16S rRNA A1518/A1519 N6-dimethyltransferase RsmA/KsgA/DIM1 with predicted DNA glycosylase/AP lyase activity
MALSKSKFQVTKVAYHKRRKKAGNSISMGLRQSVEQKHLKVEGIKNRLSPFLVSMVDILNLIESLFA